MNFERRIRFFHYQPAALLKITGADAATFLQGQFTQDLKQGGDMRMAYGLWLDQKGRVLADSFVWRESDEAWWIMSYESPAAVIYARLEGFVIADDVVIEDVTARWEGVSVLGADAEAWPSEGAGALPLAGCWSRNTSEAGGLVFRGRREASESWEWLRPAGAVRPALENGAAEVDALEMERVRIAGAIPMVPRDVGAGDLPNEAGLERAAISYTKGCYLGQEVMARLKSMGQVRRRLLRVRGSATAPGSLPAALYVGEKRVGELRSAVPIMEAGDVEGFAGLAMVSLLGIKGAETLLSLSPNGEGVIKCEEPL